MDSKCVSEGQIDQLSKYIPEILNTLFDRTEKKDTIEWVKSFLTTKMDDQRTLIKRIFFHSLPDKN